MFQTLGLNATTLAKNDPWAALPIAAKAGLRAVELMAGRSDRAMIRAAKDLADVEYALRSAKAAGLSIHALGAHRDLSQADGLGEYMILLEKAARLGCGIITTSVPDGSEAHGFADGLFRAAERAQALGVTICLETHGFEHGSGASLLPLVGVHPNLRICYDTGNVLFYSDALPQEDLPACIGKVGHLHLKDKLGGKGEWSFPALGEGVIPIAQLMALPGFKENLTASIEIEFTPQGVSLEETQRAVDASVRYLQCHSLIGE